MGGELTWHARLEPRTSRPQAGLLLTRSNLALDRPEMIANRLREIWRRACSPLHPKFSAATWSSLERVMGWSVPLEHMLSDASDQLMMYYLLRTKMWPVKEPVDLQLFDGDDEE